MCVQSFHMMNIDVPAGVGAPSLDTQPLTCNYFSSTGQTFYNLCQTATLQLAYVCIVCQHVCIHDNRRIVTSTPCGSEWNKLHGKMFCNKEIAQSFITV